MIYVVSRNNGTHKNNTRKSGSIYTFLVATSVYSFVDDNPERSYTITDEELGDVRERQWPGVSSLCDGK